MQKGKLKIEEKNRRKKEQLSYHPGFTSDEIKGMIVAAVLKLFCWFVSS
jgi:hypothetical protein